DWASSSTLMQIEERIRLIKFLIEAPSMQDILNTLHVPAIVDRETEIIQIAREALNILGKSQVSSNPEFAQLLDALISTETHIKELRDFSLRIADGVIRNEVYHRQPSELSQAMEQKFGKTEADVVFIGGGPAGLAAALHAIALGEKVVLLDQGYALQSFS